MFGAFHPTRTCIAHAETAPGVRPAEAKFFHFPVRERTLPTRWTRRALFLVAVGIRAGFALDHVGLVCVRAFKPSRAFRAFDGLLQRVLAFGTGFRKAARIFT